VLRDVDATPMFRAVMLNEVKHLAGYALMLIVHPLRFFPMVRMTRRFIARRCHAERSEASQRTTMRLFALLRMTLTRRAAPIASPDYPLIRYLSADRSPAGSSPTSAL
jgi:hypothetical protein